MSESQVPYRKISETFLDFISPVLNLLDGKPSKDEMESALTIGFAVWNSVVLDGVKGCTHFTDELRRLSSANPFTDFLILRKQTVFTDDRRLIGEYELRRGSSGWRLWAEARDSADLGSKDTMRQTT